MYAMIPAVIFAAVAAARPEAREASVIPRTALSAMKVKEAEQVCDPYQKLVCCNKDKECGEVKLGSKSSFFIVPWILLTFYRHQQVRLPLRALHCHRRVLRLRHRH